MNANKYFTKLFSILLTPMILIACASVDFENEKGESLIGASDIYTLVNLHPDSARARLFATNYQQSGFIPLCTKVTILEGNGKRIIFKTLDKKQTYEYYYHQSAVEPFPQHLDKYFGKRCNKDKVNNLSETDQKGIKIGVALKGMSKDGVIYSMGYPPLHKTHSLSLDDWVYWRNRISTMRVHFENDEVIHVSK